MVFSKLAFYYLGIGKPLLLFFINRLFPGFHNVYLFFDSFVQWNDDSFAFATRLYNKGSRKIHRVFLISNLKGPQTCFHNSYQSIVHLTFKIICPIQPVYGVLRAFRVIRILKYGEPIQRYLFQNAITQYQTVNPLKLK